MSVYIHPTAEVSEGARIDQGTRIWHHAQIRERSIIGENCIIGKGVYIDSSVVIGNNVKIQNYVSIFQGVTIEDGVFIGPHACFTNDLTPRAVNPDGSLKSGQDWQVSKTLVQTGASIGANSTILCGISIGAWAMIGAGSVLTRDIPEYALAFGTPAVLRGFVCKCSAKLDPVDTSTDPVQLNCTVCKQRVEVPHNVWKQVP